MFEILICEKSYNKISEILLSENYYSLFVKSIIIDIKAIILRSFMIFKDTLPNTSVLLEYD